MLDSESRWAGDSLVMPNLGVQLTVESQGMMKNVQLAASGTEQSFPGWRLLESELTATLRSAKGTRNPYGLPHDPHPTSPKGRGELHIQIPHLQRVLLDEFAAGFDFFAHEDAEHVVGGGD